jgi:hypothetical protein
MDDMMADILTKALLHWKVNQHVLGLGLHCPCGGVLELEGLGACADEAELYWSMACASCRSQDSYSHSITHVGHISFIGTFTFI